MSEQQLKKPNPIVAEINDTNLKVLNWRGYGILTGPGHDGHIFDNIQYRRHKIMQNVMLISGNPGDGKSYFALRLAQIFDPKFNPALQIVFEREHLLYLLSYNSPLKQGQVIIIDEAQFAAGARSWYDEVQRDLMNHIEAVRSRGFLIIIVALRLALLDKIIRNYVLNQLMSMQKRGKAQVYALWVPTFEDKLFKKKMGKLSLKLPDWEKCKFDNCLLCKYLYGQEKCYSLRAVYERQKRVFLGKMNSESQHKAEAISRRRNPFDINDMIKRLQAKASELAYDQKTGKINSESIKITFEKDGIVLGDADIKRIVKRGMLTHSELFMKKKNEGEK